MWQGNSGCYCGIHDGYDEGWESENGNKNRDDCDEDKSDDNKGLAVLSAVIVDKIIIVHTVILFRIFLVSVIVIVIVFIIIITMVSLITFQSAVRIINSIPNISPYADL